MIGNGSKMVLGAIFHRIPDLETTGIKRGVNGAISFAPDGRPMIGPMSGVPGFYVACGFLGGIAQGGGIGLAMSQWILEGESELDLHFIDVARFGDWTTREFAREHTHEILPIRYELIYPGIERTSGRPLKTTPIYNDLLAHGAVMGQAYGWERPLWYAPNGEVDEPSFQRPNCGNMSAARPAPWPKAVAFQKCRVTGSSGFLAQMPWPSWITSAAPNAPTSPEKWHCR